MDEAKSWLFVWEEDDISCLATNLEKRRALAR
jgi:hypothetical protein